MICSERNHKEVLKKNKTISTNHFIDSLDLMSPEKTSPVRTSSNLLYKPSSMKK